MPATAEPKNPTFSDAAPLVGVFDSGAAELADWMILAGDVPSTSSKKIST